MIIQTVKGLNMSSQDCLKYGFIGPEKSGKSFAALWASRNEKTMIRLNPTHEAQMMDGATVVTNKAELAKAVLLADGKKKLHLCWNFPRSMYGFEALTWAARVATACKHRCAIFINEGETCYPKQSKSAAMDGVNRMGRQHLAVPVYWTAQRPRSIHLDLRDNTNRFHIFKNNKETYKTFVKSLAGSDFVDVVQGLEKYSFLYVDDVGTDPFVCKDIKKLKS